MGVPKFFRWMSERYPAISQLIAENRIPEFDCLYLDMNGIIHNCTHKDSDDATFRMTEKDMFIAIFNYIEHLFGKIKPKQLFFMAIDGVAPRAKMNQQRARRFRTALDVEVAREKAIREGKEMPKEEAFDSNAITPGTEFMHKLTEQLKYFINKKVSEDVDWQGCEVVLSGHEVPGEGEHKIMEYIRLAKAQSEYNHNVRHCLYGLDADLIMLGLLSHDPHFCLLREEVTFGRQNKTKSKELEHQNFYLMHLCIVREYLELEFQELKEDGVLDFAFDLERVIDDFILMAFFVGNDFLPNLPNLHINEGALALMFKIYKNVLPKGGGYINEGGVINMTRLAVLLEELSHVEYRFFESESSDQAWFKGKRMAKQDVMRKGPTKLVLTTRQKEVFTEVKIFVQKRKSEALDLPVDLAAADRKFVQDLADSLHLEWRTVEDEEGRRNIHLSFPAKLIDEEGEEEDEESQIAVNRVVKQYDKAPVIDQTQEQAREEMDRIYEVKFREWKDNYYKGKFEWDRKNDTELTKLCENYIQGLQWVLYYYYRGVVSWPWYYQYHYSPMISDVIKGLGADINFQLGQPFHPYEQLMGVLPDRSKKIVPTVYHDLMTNPNSPIIDFYPRDFELDMNGKKMEWEAVVKIPFIDEKRLLAAMAPKNALLSDREKFRNEFGVSLKFTYDPEIDFTYPSSLVGIFPEIAHCRCVENVFDLPTIEGLEYRVGLMEGARLGDKALAGFPSLATIPYNATLGFHGVNVFQSDSRNESMVVTIENSEQRTNVKTACMNLGKRVFVGYPFLGEGKVVMVSDELFDYFPAEDGLGQPTRKEHGLRDIGDWRKMAERIENNYSKRLGIIIGAVESITHIHVLKGLTKRDDGATIKEYAVTPGMEHDFASQTIVTEVFSEDQRFLEKAAVPIEEEFSEGTKAFFLGEFNYGRPLSVVGHANGKANVWLSTLPESQKQLDVMFGRHIVLDAKRHTPYMPAFQVAKMLGLSPLVVGKLTSSFSVNALGLPRLNLGLNLKFEGKKLKVLGYTRRGDKGWEFSNKAVSLLTEYMTKFPEFIAGIMRKPTASEFKQSDFYDEKDAVVKIREIVEWLKSIESNKFEKVPLDAEQLDSDIVKAIEEKADSLLVKSAQPQGKVVNGVPRGALLKPADAEQRLGNQKFTLGDRVIYIPETGRVPIATRGTVVGISRTPRTTLLDVVFDLTFMSGTSLGERCTMFRGSTVPIASVLNLTQRQLAQESKAAAEKRPAPASTPLIVEGGYNAPNNYAHYRESGPPPPLRGSFRAAVASANNGLNRGNRMGRGRGRAVPPRLPSDNASAAIHSSMANMTIETLQEPHRTPIPPPEPRPSIRGAGVPQNSAINRTPIPPTVISGRGLQNGSFRGGRGAPSQTLYNSVPPPSSLDARGRGGRGRGTARGRGGRGRGRGSITGGPEVARGPTSTQ
ncbi:XRN 5'-3' exonuclease N-terminus-domain-containing protein [Calycina marina]|uniref:5'-3' exoribonuclease 1 n=1 Tax=Calycina marina TaxID=1763456 RepID=A0A9P8CG75_9HELO|nr:XRN 5'-3' exonuclease N-terminus-domain-containing protein [Calycina marina]